MLPCLSLPRHMVPGWFLCLALYFALGSGPGLASYEGPEPGTPNTNAAATETAADALLASLQPSLQDVMRDVLERNAEIARARQRAAAAAFRVPQRRALPDPVVAWNLFVLPPETRSGPQRFSATVRQTFPGFGKLELDAQIAWFEAVAVEADVEKTRLDVITETRRLMHELTFLDAQERLVTSERGALVRYERAAQARYAAGTGLQQEIVRIQTQITRTDTLLLEIEERRVDLRSQLNALRDRPPGTSIELRESPKFPEQEPNLDALRRSAHAHRPEVAAVDARLAAHRLREERAAKERRPNLTVGLTYTAVEPRRDAAGRAAPPEDNGDDILALNGSVNLPVRRGKLEAALHEAQALRRAEEEAKRHLLSHIDRHLGDLSARIPLLQRHLKLLEGVLLKQAREALRSAETAYSTGKLNAIDLLDAEVVLFEVQVAAARTRADLAIAWTRLEHAAGGPVTAPTEETSP